MPLIHSRRRHRIVTGDVGSLIVIAGVQDPDGRLEEWNGAPSYRTGHRMRMTVQLSYGVMYVCELAVGFTTVPKVPVGLTKTSFRWPVSA